MLVVGPSGVGKDTVIEGVRAAGRDDIVFARREITRPAEAGGEDHLPVTEAEFARREADGGYALSWRAHGLGYGVPAEITQDLAAGRSVVANVSRGVLDEARKKFPRLLIVSITADAERLRARLLARGRETAEDIEGRVARAAAFVVAGDDVVDLANDGAPQEAVEAFLALL